MQPVAIHLGMDVNDQDFGHVLRQAQITGRRYPRCNVRTLLFGERRVIEKFAGFLRVLERIIGAEHHPLCAERGNACS